MDSRMIDVAIGLVLVFALASLAVTTLHEIWASVGKARGRNLEVAVRALLGEGGRQDGFASRLLSQPLIVSLADSPLVGSGKPSYIGADVFVTTLVRLLSKMYTAGVRPDTPAALVTAVRLGAGKLDVPEPQLDLINGLASLLDGAEADWDAYLKRLTAWYDAVGERSIGWYKRATQMRLFALGLLLAVVVNINPFVIAPRLWHDEVMRTATVKMAERVSAARDASASEPAGSTQLREMLAAALQPDAARKAAPASAASPIEAEFDDSHAALERGLAAAVAAQRQRGSVLLLQGLQDLLEQLPALERYARMRRSAALAGNGADVRAASEALQRRILQFGTRLDALDLQGSAISMLQDRYTELRDAAGREQQRLQPEAPRPVAARRCPALADPDQRRLCEDVVTATSGVAELGLPVGWTFANLPECASGPCVLEAMEAIKPAARSGVAKAAVAAAPAAASTPGSAAPAVNATLDSADTWPSVKTCAGDAACAGVSVIGWLATALATMLGAPFWFDLLSKLINVRGAGKRPTDEAAAAKPGGGAAPDMLTPSAPPASTVPSAPPGAGGGAGTMRDVQTAAEAQLSPPRVIEVQAALQSFGAKRTGFFDTDTREAITKWQTSIGDPATGELTQAQIERLLAPSSAAVVASALHEADEHVDGCDVEITLAVPDENLPASQGGVA